MKRIYKCLDCGHIFIESDAEDYHYQEYWNEKYGESNNKVPNCPKCGYKWSVLHEIYEDED